MSKSNTNMSEVESEVDEASATVVLTVLGTNHEIAMWAGTRTFKELWRDCPRADWMEEILHHMEEFDQVHPMLPLSPPWEEIRKAVACQSPADLRRCVPWAYVRTFVQVLMNTYVTEF